MGEGRESHCFHGVKEGGQSSQTEFKRSTVEKWLSFSTCIERSLKTEPLK